MGLDPEANKFLGDINETAKGFNPDVSRLVDELRYQQLGKPIVHAATPPSEHLQQRAVSALEALSRNAQTPLESAPQQHGEELIGYIMPVNPGQDRYLIIIKDGTMLVTEPNPDSYQTLDIYRRNFAPNNSPLTFYRTDPIPRVIQMLSIPYYYHNKILFRNDNPADVAEIDDAREQAVQTAVILREQRQKAIRETSARLVAGFDQLFNPPKQPPPE